MIYSWTVDVILRDGSRFSGEYETEQASPSEVIYELLYEEPGVLRAFFAFQNQRKREVYVISPDEVAAMTLTAPQYY